MGRRFAAPGRGTLSENAGFLDASTTPPRGRFFPAEAPGVLQEGSLGSLA